MEKILSQDSTLYQHSNTKNWKKIERGVYVFGLHRTGTHFLQKLINRNFNCWTLEHNEKHCYDFESQKDFRYETKNTFLTMYKSPYKWIDSLTRNSHNFIHITDISLESGHTPFEIISDVPDDTFSNKKKNIVSLEKICQHYNKYFYFWFDWSKKIKHHHFIRYESLLFDTEEVLKEICEKNNFELIGNEFSFDKVTNSKIFTKSQQDYYKKDILINLHDKHINIINNIIDHKILERLNINVINK